MLSFPNAKINLGLNIVSKRSDGYHNIESCFYPIPWCDVLEIIPSDELIFTSSGLDIPGSQDANLCLKAFYLLKEEFGIENISIHLHKVIPMGAGLGGGSSDGAFAIKMLNDIFNLNIGTKKLQSLANQLGADCPFFIDNKPAYVTGTGDQFDHLDINLKGKYLALQNPNIHISTQEAFSNISPHGSVHDIREIIQTSPDGWQDLLKNDFEPSVFPNHPEIERIKKSFYSKGALYASMTGSGSTVYGIFDSDPKMSGETFQL